MNRTLFSNITVEGLIDLYKINKNAMEYNIPRYEKFINSDRRIKRIRNNLYTRALSLSKQSSNKYDEHNQQGGDALAIGIGLGTMLMVSLSFLLYWWFTRKVCRPEYPLIDEETVPTIADILMKLLPKSWTKGIEGMDPVQYVLAVQRKVEQIAQPLSFLTAQTTGQEIGLGIGRVLVSAGAAALTLGAGGDLIISMIFTIKSVLETIVTVIRSLLKLISERDTLRILYDIFNIKFSDGPHGVKCWMAFIINEYGADSEVFSIVCGFFNDILDKLAEFAANALSSVIPDNVGLIGIIGPMIIDYAKKGLLTLLENQLNGYYDRIPADKQVLLEHPKLMKKWLDEQLDFAKMIILGYGEQMFNVLKQFTGLFAKVISRMLAMVFSLIYIFISCV